MAEPPTKKPTLDTDYAVANTSQGSPKTEVPVEIGDSSKEDVPMEPDPIEEGLKVVHLTDECLEKILRYLNLCDLTNAAEANVRLASIAKGVFAQIHQNHRLFLKSRGDVIQIPEWHPMVDSDHFVLTTTIVENIFKHFGKYMRRVKVFHALGGFRSPPNYNLAALIIQYCGDTLLEFELFGSTVFNVMRNNTKPFKRVERLVFCEIVTRMSPVNSLRDMFPNLRTLEFHNVFHVFESFRLEEPFPLLEHFAIYTFPYAKFDPAYIPVIQQIVNTNPSLRGLSVYDMKLALNEFSLESMPNIRRLEIGGRLMFPRPAFDFGNVNSLRLIYSNENEANQIEYRSLPPQLERLEVIGFKINDRTISIIQQCKILKSLVVMSFEEMDLECVAQLADKLHHIEEVEFISKYMENPKLVNAYEASLIFVEKCNTLRKATATIQIEKTESRYRINKWHFTKNKEYLGMYRERLQKVLVFNWWRWSIRPYVGIVDFLKGWQSGVCFSASIINNHAE